MTKIFDLGLFEGFPAGTPVRADHISAIVPVYPRSSGNGGHHINVHLCGGQTVSGNYINRSNFDKVYNDLCTKWKAME